MSNLMRDRWLKKNAPDAFEEEQKTRRKRVRREGSMKQKAASGTSLFPDLYQDDYNDDRLEKALVQRRQARRMFSDLFSE